jgi:hypothetical protein
LNITTISHRRLLVETEGQNGTDRLLALDTGIPSGGFAAQRISALARNGGILVSPGGVLPWGISRIVTSDGRIFLCGPWLEGITLDEALEHQGYAPDPSHVRAVARGLATAIAPGGHVLCNTGTSLLTRDGGLLLLEASLAGEINRYLPLERQQTAVFPYTFSRLEGTAAWAYQCGTLIGHLVTGRPLCTGETREEADRCHDRLRSEPGLHRLQPSLHSRATELVESLIRSPRDPEAITAIRSIGDIAETGNLLEEIDPAEVQRRRDAAVSAVEKSARSWGRRQFVHHRGRTIAVALLAAVLIGTIPFQMIKSRLTPPSTAGLEPKSLASAFYDAWEDMDHITMDEALARGTADDLVKEVTNVYVMDRVQLAHTMEGSIMSAREWLAAGRPDGKLPYGPIVSTISILRQGEEEVVVQVEYELWRPAPAADVFPDATDTEGLVATRSTVRDRLTMTPSRWGWEISGIASKLLTGPEPVPAGASPPQTD